MTHLQQRLLVGTLAALIIAGGIWIGAFPCFRPLFATGVALIIGLALWEYYSLARQIELDPPHTLGLIISTFYLLALFLVTQYPVCGSLPTIVLALGVAAIFAYFFFCYDRPLENIAVTLFGIGYITLTLSGIIGIMFLDYAGGDDGRLWLMYLIVVTKITDTAAYFFGKTLGKKKLAPSLSPKKTWAGALGGLSFALIASLGLYFLKIDGLHLKLPAAIMLGLFIGMLAQVGDLAESVLKRSAKVKDSSHLPGLGGVLDVVDSLIFTTPLLYLYLQCRQGM
jgi:phosphatidate cytidylyltransferase